MWWQEQAGQAWHQEISYHSETLRGRLRRDPWWEDCSSASSLLLPYSSFCFHLVLLSKRKSSRQGGEERKGQPLLLASASKKNRHLPLLLRMHAHDTVSHCCCVAFLLYMLTSHHLYGVGQDRWNIVVGGISYLSRQGIFALVVSDRFAYTGMHIYFPPAYLSFSIPAARRGLSGSWEELSLLLSSLLLLLKRQGK